MKVVITGGTGFIGLNLARALLRRGRLTGPSGAEEKIDAITLFDVAAPPTRPDGLDDRVSIVTGDIADRETIVNLIDRDDISVFHLASVVSAGGERDFDLAMAVNLDGGRNVFEACRARNGLPRVVFASSIAVYGGAAMPETVSDRVRQTSRTTYGITKSICELLVNDYTRKSFFDGRSARLPTVIVRPGKPNAAASSFASGVFREPLHGEECVLPVTPETTMPVLGYRSVVNGFIALHEADSAAIGDDRGVLLPNVSYTVTQMIEAVKRVAAQNEIVLGPITSRPDPAIQAIVDTWARHADADRALKLGLPKDESLDRVIQDFIDDFMPKA